MQNNHIVLFFLLVFGLANSSCDKSGPNHAIPIFAPHSMAPTDHLSFTPENLNDFDTIADLVNSNELELIHSVHNHSQGYPSDDSPEVSKIIYWSNPHLMIKYLPKMTAIEIRILEGYSPKPGLVEKGFFIDDIKFIPHTGIIKFNLCHFYYHDKNGEDFIIEHIISNTSNIKLNRSWPNYKLDYQYRLNEKWIYSIATYKRYE